MYHCTKCTRDWQLHFLCLLTTYFSFKKKKKGNLGSKHSAFANQKAEEADGDGWRLCFFGGSQEFLCEILSLPFCESSCSLGTNYFYFLRSRTTACDRLTVRAVMCQTMTKPAECYH